MRKSKVVAYFLLSFIAGVALRSFVSFDAFILFVIGLIGLIGGVTIFNKSRKLAFLLFGGIFIFLGFLRFDAAVHESCQTNEQSVTCLNEQVVGIKGLVAEEPDVRERNIQYKLAVNNYDGNILLFGPSFPEYNFGDALALKCRLSTPEPFEDFDYPGFLAKDKVYSVCFEPISLEQVAGSDYSLASLSGLKQRLIALKSSFKETIDESINFPQSTFLNSILLGLRREVPQNIQDNFAATGTSHLMAISGLHIVILTTLIFSLFRGVRVPKRYAIWFALVFIILFIGLIGFRASAIRAGIFGTIGMLAFALGRPSRALNLLLLAASALLITNPLLLRFDLGFQLSFLAVLGLMLLGPYFKRWLERIPNDWLGLRDILVMTLSAQLFVLPWLLYNFGNLSIGAPLANVLVLPVIPLIMGLGFALVIAGLVWQPLAAVIGFVELILIGYMLTITKWLASVPLFNFHLSLPLWAALLIYVLLLIILLNQRVRALIVENLKRVFSFSSKQKPAATTEVSEVVTEEFDLSEFEPLETDEEVEQEKGPRRKRGKQAGPPKWPQAFWRVKYILLGLVGLIILILLLWPGSSSRRPELKVVFFDVGQGDSHLIMAPGGQNILVDGGPDSTVIAKLGKYLPLTTRTIDLMILTHPHADHVTGLTEVLQRYQVERVLSTGVVHPTNEYIEWLDIVEKKKIQFDKAVAPKRYVFKHEPEPLILEVIYPDRDLAGQRFEDPNESSVVVSATYGETSFLFTGDITVEIEGDLVNKERVEDVDVLKVAHQGSDTSSAQEFLEAVQPEYAVIPVGANDFGHPSLRVIRRLERIRAQVLRTDKQGDIVFTSDGISLQLK